MPVLMPVGIVIVFLAIGLLDTIIVIPAYALTFASIYRVLEPRLSDVVETAPIQMQDGDGETVPIEPELSYSTDDKSAENTL